MALTKADHVNLAVFMGGGNRLQFGEQIKLVKKVLGPPADRDEWQEVAGTILRIASNYPFTQWPARAASRMRGAVYMGGWAGPLPEMYPALRSDLFELEEKLGIAVAYWRRMPDNFVVEGTYSLYKPKEPAYRELEWVAECLWQGPDHEAFYRHNRDLGATRLSGACYGMLEWLNEHYQSAG